MIDGWKFKKKANLVVVNTNEYEEEMLFKFEYRNLSTILVKERYDRKTSAKKYPLPYQNYQQ